MTNNLITLFQAWADQENPPIIELQDINHKPIGALYLDKLSYKKILISETNNSESYFLYIDGIGIYFSFYKKINPLNIV
jgi:hypothetical protein